MKGKIIGTVLAGLLLASCSTLPRNVMKKETWEEVTALQNAEAISIGYNEIGILERDGRDYKFQINYKENSGIDSVNLIGYQGKDLSGKSEYVKLSKTDIEYSLDPEIRTLGRIMGMVPLMRGVVPQMKGLFLVDLNETMYKMKVGRQIGNSGERKVRLEGYFDYAPVY